MTESNAEASTTLVRSSAVMAAGTVVSRVLGFARTAVVAAALGIQVTGDTFSVANTVPNIIYILLAGGVLNAVFVPQLVRAMTQGNDFGRAYTDRLLTLAGLVLLGITVVATAAAPLVIALYTDDSWTDSDTATSVAFAFWCLPQIFFYGLYTMLGQILNARGSFGPMMWAPVVNNVVAIATGLSFIALFTVDPEQPASLSGGAIAFLGVGTTLGVALQALALVPVLRRTGFRFRPRLDLRGVGLRRTADLARWTLLFVLVNQLAYVVIVNLGTRANEAARGVLDYGVGYLAYSSAYLIFILPHSIITVSVVTGLLPQLSRDAAAGRLDAVRDALSHAWRLTAIGIVLAAAGYLSLGSELTGVLFAGNSVEDAHYIGLLTTAFALGLPAFSAQYVALRGFYAFEDTRTPFLLQVVIAATNVALALLAYAVLPLELKMVGVAAAYALTYVIGLALSTAVLRRRVGGLDGGRVVRTYVRLTLAALPAAGAATAVSWLIGRAMGDGVAGSLVALTAGGAVLVGLYLSVAHLLHVDELGAV
ncbi:MAG: murein biosynthesis integral membrane protein MurJ, partial [Sporichthyaceae bacterium]|nr:murein biosynthesis integral membrane protein MurJ [Sporichthyaceae bacterium]